MLRLQLVILALLAASLSCNMPLPQEAEPTAVSAPAEDPKAILTQVSEAVASSESGGEIVIELTEGQLSAAANAALLDQGTQEVKNLQIDLKEGLATLTGSMNQGGVDFPLKIDLTIAVDGSGTPYVTIVDGKLGPLPLPQSILDQLQSQFDQMIQSQVRLAAGDALVKSIVIHDGSMLITAEKR